MTKVVSDFIIAALIAGTVPAHTQTVDSPPEVPPPVVSQQISEPQTEETPPSTTESVEAIENTENSNNVEKIATPDVQPQQPTEIPQEIPSNVTDNQPNSSISAETPPAPSDIEPTPEIKPENTRFDHDIASYITKYSGSESLNRNYNMRLASDSIHGVILQPGEVFSFNDTILAKSHNGKDYKSAAIYVNGKVSSGIGGGICQISSTLYQAALYSGMTITQRRNHSLRVGYMPAGRDATVSWGSIDFQFRNDLEIPVMIESVMKNNTLKVRFLSQKDPKIGDIKVVVSSKNGGYTLNRIRENGTIDYSASSYYKK